METFKNVWIRLLYPFLVMTIIWIFYYSILLIGYRELGFKDIIPYIIGAFISPGKDIYSFHPVCVPLWFLLALAEVKIVASIFRNWTLWLLASLACIVLSLCITIYQIQLPFALDSFILSLPFFAIGKYLKKFFLNEICLRSTLIVAICAAFITFFFNHINGTVDINKGVYGDNIVLFYLNGLSGTICTIYIIKAVISAMGNKFNSSNFIIRTMHIWVSGSILVIAFSRYLSTIVKSLLPSLCHNNIGGFFIGLFVVILLYPCIVFVQKIYPRALGSRQ